MRGGGDCGVSANEYSCTLEYSYYVCLESDRGLLVYMCKKIIIRDFFKTCFPNFVPFLVNWAWKLVWKKNFSQNLNMGIKTKQNFRWFWNRWEKCEEFANKKVLGKKVCKIGVCPLLYMYYYMQTCFANNFFLVHFFNYLYGFEISVKFCIFG